MAQEANGLSCGLLTVRIDHPSFPPGPIQGYRFFWAFYVTGYDRTRHCQPCFLGTPSTQINTPNARSGRDYQMDERKTFPYLYICGFASGPKGLRAERNFHLALKPQERRQFLWRNLQRLHGQRHRRRITPHSRTSRRLARSPIRAYAVQKLQVRSCYLWLS
jgi:hypothetical protein